jgi:coenzyme F420-reducing hydrogenase gamma subunit
MIQSVSAYKVGERFFPTIEEAQKEELLSLLLPEGQIEKNESAQEVIDNLVHHTDEVVAILTCAPKSKKPRSDKGRKRGPRSIALAGQ